MFYIFENSFLENLHNARQIIQCKWYWFRFEGSDRYILNVRKNRLKAGDNQSMQSVSRDFISNLITNGFTGTVTTILSIANKIQGPATSGIRCVLCATVYNAEEGERFVWSYLMVA